MSYEPTPPETAAAALLPRLAADRRVDGNPEVYHDARHGGTRFRVCLKLTAEELGRVSQVLSEGV